MRPFLLTFLLAAVPAVATTATGSHMSAHLSTGHVTVNGIALYYEQYGPAVGTPLVLLPGGGSTIQATFGRFLPLISRHRRVIAFEEQGHGRSGTHPGPERFEQSADDVAAALEQLDIARADVMGFSNGANNALLVAIRHPERVRKLVFASSFTKRTGAQSWFWPMIANANFDGMPAALKAEFLRVNPDTAALRRMHDRDLERMHAFTDLPDEQVRSVKAPTLILCGDRDVVTNEHALELTRVIVGARLLILPGTHGDYLGDISAPARPRAIEATAGLVEEFLAEATDERK
jgi:pimeloyl-ACP methyl ester carboxylesterase